MEDVVHPNLTKQSGATDLYHGYRKHNHFASNKETLWERISVTLYYLNWNDNFLAQLDDPRLNSNSSEFYSNQYQLLASPVILLVTPINNSEPYTAYLY